MEMEMEDEAFFLFPFGYIITKLSVWVGTRGCQFFGCFSFPFLTYVVAQIACTYGPRFIFTPH